MAHQTFSTAAYTSRGWTLHVQAAFDRCPPRFLFDNNGFDVSKPVFRELDHDSPNAGDVETWTTPPYPLQF
jgi:hypothetical protein